MMTMRADICRFALGAAVALAAFAANAWIGGVTTQKFIGHGWDTLQSSPEEALAHAEEFDRTGLDGITVCLGGKTDGGTSYSFATIMTDAPWDFAALRPRLETLRRFKEHPGLRESFLMFWLAPRKRIAWDDDRTWGNFATNLGVLAKLGAAAGMKGYFVDGEDYPKTKQFTYDAAKDGGTFAAACKLARRRGAEVFGVLFREHPDATLLSFWFLSLGQVGYAPLRDPVARMKQTGDLWPAFVNGILDVMPPTAVFVDGDEHAYNYDSTKKDFYTKSLNQRHTALGLVARKNRAKYASQLSVGFGLYLDLYKNPGDLARLERNLVQAAEVSTEYVWIYGEQHNWVGWNKLGDRTWEQAIPGLSEALVSIKDPQGFMKTKLARLQSEGNAVNLIRDSLDGVSFWHEEGTRPEIVSNAVSWQVSMSAASILAGHSVLEGELYAASVSCRGYASDFKATVHWRRTGSFDWNKPEVPIFFGAADKSGWRSGRAAARVPVDVDELVIQCDCHADKDKSVEVAGFSLVRIR